MKSSLLLLAAVLGLGGCAALKPGQSITLTDAQYDECLAQRGCVVISRQKLVEVAKKLCESMGGAE